MEKIEIFIVDDNAIFREGLLASFAKIEDIDVAGYCGIDDEALELVVNFNPEIVLLDIGIPLLNGLGLARQITQRSPVISMVVLTPYDNDEYLFEAVKSGAASYMGKNITVAELATIIRRVHRGEYVINETVLTRPEVAERVLKQFQDLSLIGTAVETLTAPLTSRELEILNYVARGYVNKLIAYKLGISEQTVKNHMSSILRKLNANDRTQAVVTALHYGWISSQVRKPTEITTSDRFEPAPHCRSDDSKEDSLSLLTARENL